MVPMRLPAALLPCPALARAARPGPGRLACLALLLVLGLGPVAAQARGGEPRRHTPGSHAETTGTYRNKRLNFDSRRDVTVATFNVHNFYRYRERVQPRRSQAEARRASYLPQSQEEYRDKVRALATTITKRLKNPDIIALQEVENYIRTFKAGHEPVLTDLVQEISRQNQQRGKKVEYRWAMCPGVSDRRGISQAFLYRGERVRLCEADPSDPLLRSRGTGQPFNQKLSNPKSLDKPATRQSASDNQGSRLMARPTLVGKFEVYKNGLPAAADAGRGEKSTLYILNNHLKSNPRMFQVRRREQALFNVKLLQELWNKDPQANVIVAGDMNVDYNRPECYAQLNPLNIKTPAVKSSPSPLFNVTAKVSKKGRHTYNYRNTMELLDWVYASSHLQKRLVQVRIPHINSEACLPENRSSDHDPVLTRFRLFD